MRVIMTGGGTGGHIYPAIAIANKIKSIDKDAEILFVGSRRGLEKDLVPKNGYPIKLITVSGFNRKRILTNVKTVADLMKGNLEARSIIKKFKPDVVIGTGGYVCGPVVRAAAKLGARTFIHEQNAYPGMTNKMLEKYVEKVFISFEPARKYFKEKDKLVMSGNPVRQSFFDADATAARESLGIRPDETVILSFGGSQGAGKINEMMLELLGKFNGAEGIRLYFVTGKYYNDNVKKEIASRGITLKENVVLMEYIDNMEKYLPASDIIISRSGALTVSEITVCGKASIMIPSPNVTGNHQYHNAKSVADVGGAELIEEKDITPDILYEKIMALIDDPAARMQMAENAKKAAPKDAAAIIADYVFKA